MIHVEKELRDIFNKDVITEKDMHRANELIRIWKHFNKWETDETEDNK